MNLFPHVTVSQQDALTQPGFSKDRRRGSASLVLVVIMLLGLTAAAHSEPQPIRYATVQEHPDSYHYYLELLEAALPLMDQDYYLEHMGEIPQIRIQSMLEAGTIDVFWMVQNSDRDLRYHPTNVGIADGLIGKRVMMIRPEDQILFDDVQTLDDFRELGLTVGFGRGWVDRIIWEANDLAVYEEQGVWDVMFDKLKRDRGDFDYLSRSVKELPKELDQHPELVAEENLMLVYERDETFYVSPQNDTLQRELSSALQALYEDGTIQETLHRYWGAFLDELDIDERTVIELYTPPLDQ